MSCLAIVVNRAASDGACRSVNPISALARELVDAIPPGVGTVALPALLLFGGPSHPSIRSVAHRLAAALPDARFVELEGSGHVTYAERPDEFENAVRAFAAELDRRTTSAST